MGKTKATQENEKPKRTAKKSVRRTLVLGLMPIIVIGIIIIIAFLTFNAKKTITEVSCMDLQAETNSNAYNIGTGFRMLTAKFGQYCDTMEQLPFETHDDLLKYIEPSAKYTAVENTGIFVGFSDDSYIFANHTKEDDSWKPTEQPWYKAGIGHETFVETDPAVDPVNNKLCISFVRQNDFFNGEVGVCGTNVYLSDIQAAVNELTPMKTGASMIIGGDYIISYSDESLNGKMISKDGTDYIKSIKNLIDSGSSKVVTLDKGGSIGKVYVAISPIQGTSWTLVSSVPVKDVEATANNFMVIAVVAMVILILIIIFVIILTVNKVITKPVNGLLAGILKVSDGDLTVHMPPSNGDEIGLICSEIDGYVQTMNSTISSIQDKADRLKDDSNVSKAASEKMTREADEQSESMRQIQTTMDDISNAVGELANNATQLAGAVSDLTDSGSATNDTMLELVKRAEVGHKDMNTVQRNMEDITLSMNEMNEVVTTVGKSAEKITEIVEMIDSISQQTNLLSLNASIEAARAGEAGKGFAVVADEIGNLAQNSQESAKEISNIIIEITQLIQNLADKSQVNMDSITENNEAVSKAGQSFNMIYEDLNKAAETMREMIEMMGDVNNIASSVAAISEEQSASSQEVNATVASLAASAQDIADESQGVETAAVSVSDSAISINSELSKFKID